MADSINNNGNEKMMLHSCNDLTRTKQQCNDGNSNDTRMAALTTMPMQWHSSISGKNNDHMKVAAKAEMKQQQSLLLIVYVHLHS